MPKNRMELSLKRIGDRHIMEAFEESGFKLNPYQFHLYVQNVSNIVDVSRDRLCRLDLKVTRNQCKSTYSISKFKTSPIRNIGPIEKSYLHHLSPTTKESSSTLRSMY